MAAAVDEQAQLSTRVSTEQGYMTRQFRADNLFRQAAAAVELR